MPTMVMAMATIMATAMEVTMAGSTKVFETVTTMLETTGTIETTCPVPLKKKNEDGTMFFDSWQDFDKSTMHDVNLVTAVPATTTVEVSIEMFRTEISFSVELCHTEDKVVE